MFKKLMFAFGCFMFVLATAGMARADSITYTIGTGNTAVSGVTGDTGPYANLLIDLTSSTSATFTFTGTTVSGYTNEFWEVALNLADPNATLGSTITSSPTMTWTQGNCTTGGGCAMDGFGKYNFELSDGSGAGSAVNSLSFSLTWSDGTTYASAGDILTGNSDGDLTAIHTVIFSPANCGSVSGDNVCTTGYAGNSTPIPPVVPEPPTLLLLGTGFALLAGTLKLRHLV